MPYKAMIDKLGNRRLRLSNMRANDIKSLAQALKGSQIRELDLSYCNIGCNGLKCLTRVLRDTQITSLTLINTNIRDESVNYLVENLIDTKITWLDLTKNNIGCDAAQNINEMLSNSELQTLFFDIHYTEEGVGDNSIFQRVYRHNQVDLTLKSNKLGMKGFQYLNKTFRNIANGFFELTLGMRYLEADDAQHLAQAFEDTNIYKLNLSYRHIMQHNGVKYLVQAFKHSQLAKLNVLGERIRAKGAQYLADFLREMNVVELDLRHNCIGDYGMKLLAPALKHSDIMNIDLGSNDIKAEGAKYLAEILQDSKIIHLGLCNNSIGAEGARHLADGLPHSQVTHIHLHGNYIEYIGYQYLIDVVENTNISWINLHENNIEAGLEGAILWPYDIASNSVFTRPTSMANSICQAFKSVVSLNPLSNEFEFIVPRKSSYDSVDIDQYVFLIKTLNDIPNFKVQIFYEMCRTDFSYDFNMMNKINEFITKMPSKFNTFIDSKLPELVELFANNKYVNLVKQFELMKLYDVVQNLLLHRVLYFVDENEEILHTYCIYKMLHKYSIPLYNDELDPNRREEIISFCQSHQDIDGVEEIIDLLGSESFK